MVGAGGWPNVMVTVPLPDEPRYWPGDASMWPADVRATACTVGNPAPEACPIAPISVIVVWPKSASACVEPSKPVASSIHSADERSPV